MHINYMRIMRGPLRQQPFLQLIYVLFSGGVKIKRSSASRQQQAFIWFKDQWYQIKNENQFFLVEYL